MQSHPRAKMGRTHKANVRSGRHGDETGALSLGFAGEEERCQSESYSQCFFVRRSAGSKANGSP